MKALEAKQRLKTLIVTILVSLSTSAAFAGADGSGGGAAVVCRDPKDLSKIISVELLDLYEAKKRGKTIINSSQLWELQVPAAIDRIADPRKKLKLGEGSAEMTFDKVPFVQPMNDLGNTEVVPANCQIEWIANFVGTVPLRANVKSDLFNLLSETDKAALAVHEAVYYNRRVFESFSGGNEYTSENSRKVVGELFSTNPDQTVIDSIIYSFGIGPLGGNAPFATVPTTANQFELQVEAQTLHNPSRTGPSSVSLKCLDKQFRTIELKRLNIYGSTFTYGAYTIQEFSGKRTVYHAENAGPVLMKVAIDQKCSYVKIIGSIGLPPMSVKLFANGVLYVSRQSLLNFVGAMYIPLN